MKVDERLQVRRLKVVRFRGVRTTDVSGDAGFGPVDLDVEAGTLVAVSPPARGRTLLDVLVGRVEAVGSIEIAGRVLNELTADQRRTLCRRSMAKVTLTADGGAPLPGTTQDGSPVTVRQFLAPGPGRPAATPPIGPALPLRPLLDSPLSELDAPTRGLLAIARALSTHADVLLLDITAVPDESPVAARLAGALRDLVDLEGRTVVVTVGHPVLLDVAEHVISLPAG